MDDKEEKGKEDSTGEHDDVIEKALKGELPEQKKAKEEAKKDKSEPNDESKNLDKSKEEKKETETDMIPRWRLNQELEKQKLLQSQVAGMQSQIQMLMATRGNVTKKEEKDIIEEEAKAIAEEQELDLDAARKLAKRIYNSANKQAAELVNKEVGSIKKQMSGLLVNTAINEALEKYPRGKKYINEIKEMVMAVKDESLRLDHDVIIDAAKIAADAHYEEEIAEAEKRGAKKVQENKKVVVSGNEQTSGNEDAEHGLTQAQIAWADKMGVPRDKYAKEVAKMRK